MRRSWNTELFWNPALLRLALSGVAVLGLVGCGEGGRDPDRRGDAPEASIPGPAAAEGEHFIDATATWALDAMHQSGRAGAFHFPEINGGGAALFDFDGDGDLDAALASGGSLSSSGACGGAVSLWRNEAGRFVAQAHGLESSTDALYPTGFATGDLDRDGHLDLLITGWGGQRLWRGVGDGRFIDATEAAGLAAAAGEWGLSASFVDLDRDGWLDLYVTRYVAYDPARPETCRHRLGGLDYCGPGSFQPLIDRAYRNAGADRTADSAGDPKTDRPGGADPGGDDPGIVFQPWSDAMLIVPPAPGMGVASIDLEGDGRDELAVGNDQQANFLWQAVGDRLENVALLAGSALDGTGKPEASMGLAVGDLDGDGDEDLVVSHLEGESHTVYENDGRGGFVDATAALGLGSASLPATGFGIGLLDADLDGDLDLFVANGSVTAREELLVHGDAFPYEQDDQLFLNRLAEGEGFVDAGDPALAHDAASRGVALGDVDNDGAVDLLITAVDAPARLLRGVPRGAWVGLRVVEAPRLAPDAGRGSGAVGAEAGGIDALGARVRLGLTDGSVRLRAVHTDGSYLSASDPRVVFGLGSVDGAPRFEPVFAEVTWPDGTIERFPPPPVGRYTTLRRGEGLVR